jgi:predicted secreted hydrolase
VRLGLLLVFACACSLAPADAPTYPAVLPGRAFVFPRDHGSHPGYRIEWWYFTGWIDDASIEADRSKSPRGFQVTFFRVRPGVAEDNPSAFAPRQLLFAHAALADPAVGRLRHSQRSGRVGFGLVEASETGMSVRLDDWSLQTLSPGHYRTVVRGEEFSLDLQFASTQPPLLQGDGGFSRKGPDARAASYYYSLPQLEVSGTVTVDGKARAVHGRAWFDHEWSSDYVDDGAVGWDWLGVNLADGGALMSFRMRDARGRARWATAAMRATKGGRASPAVTFAPDEVSWTPGETWQSPRTGTRYPIEWRVSVGDRRYRVVPLLRDAELDSRGSTGILYWEGPVRLLDAASGMEVGRGYLELTGYDGKLEL